MRRQEDAQRCAGRRREALFVSLLHLSGNAAAIVVSVLITAVGWAGMKTDECAGFPQPAGGVWFLRYGIFLCIIPATHLLNAVMIAIFPIRGARLAALERRQQARWEPAGMKPAAAVVVAAEGEQAAGEEDGNRAPAAAVEGVESPVEIQLT